MARGLRFSVGIPTRNQAEYLPATLDSLLQQKRMPDEIVISDHGSTDGTAEIVNRYVKRFPALIRAIRPADGANLTDQYNFTLASQTGDWITLLSSDDLALPNFCEVFARDAEQFSDAALLRAPWRNIDARGKVLGQEYLLSVPREQRAPQTLIDQRYGPKVNFAAFAIRRAAFEASGPIPAAMESLADWALFAQLAPFGSFVRSGEIVSSYRVGHDGNKFRTRFGMWVRDEQRMFAEVLPLAAERIRERVHDGIRDSDLDRARDKDRAWIAEASRANFLRYLRAAAREFRLEERYALLPALRPWATSVGELGELSRFAAGEKLQRPLRLGEIPRRLLRPVVRRVAHSVAHTLARR